MKRIAVIVVALLVVAGAAWWLTRAKPVAVTVVTVSRGAVSATVANTRAGTVDACQRARLSPALGGQIATLPVKDGDHVEKGALLLELWNEDVKAQLTLSERDARASRSLAREACVTADVAKRDADRLMRLHEQKLASEEAADQAEGKAEANAAACTAAEDTAPRPTVTTVTDTGCARVSHHAVPATTSSATTITAIRFIGEEARA